MADATTHRTLAIAGQENTVEVAAHIKALYGVVYSHAGCIKLMHRTWVLSTNARKACRRRLMKPNRRPSLRFMRSFCVVWPIDEVVYFADAFVIRNISPARAMAGSGRAKVALRRNFGTPAH